MSSENSAIHLIAGGAGGTAGAVLTCPLEVVKTRLQASFVTDSVLCPKPSPKLAYAHPIASASYTTCASTPTTSTQTVLNSQASLRTRTTTSGSTHTVTRTSGLWRCLKQIVRNEGASALFKGLGPNLIGVAPSRAIYFCSYAQAKAFFNTVIPPETPLVHICSAAFAGFTASTATNPIWFVKTRLQLDQKRMQSLTAVQCIRQVYRIHGLSGFYKGITASYYGISETVIHFVIYEAIKAKLREIKIRDSVHPEDIEVRNAVDFFEFMAAGATSKTIATCIAYPHEVARTRLREEGNKYRGFWQTLGLVGKEEGLRGLYRGLVTQLVRQIPNTAIMMATYEAVVYMCQQHLTH